MFFIVIGKGRLCDNLEIFGGQVAHNVNNGFGVNLL